MFPFSAAVGSPVPGNERYGVLKRYAGQVIAPVLPGVYRLIASACAPFSASSSTGSLKTSVPTGIDTDLRPPNRISRLVPGTTFDPVFCTPTYAWPMTTGWSPKLFDRRMRHFSPHTLGGTMRREEWSRATLLGSAKSISGCPTV